MLESFLYAKEVRIFNLRTFLIDKVINSREKADKVQLDNSKRLAFEGSFFIVSDFILQIALNIYLIFRVLARGLEIGSMTIYSAAVGEFSGALNRITKAYLALANLSLNINELEEFISIPLSYQKSGNQLPAFDGQGTIEFKNVSFRYPGSDHYALKNINITLRGNEKLCIVGTNGSGKSTFVKLLTGLYAPTTGEILLNGVSINAYDHQKYQALFAPVFQDFALYHLTLGENIVLSNVNCAERLDTIYKKSGLAPLVDQLEKGVEAQVHKWIYPDGFEPSGGEGQRIAIARAIYHNAPIMLLDEPTAALDPVAEHEIYTQFNDMITNKTAVLITHRLSAVQLADRVAVFEKGGIVEMGSHQELYENGKLYRDMFDKQSAFYRGAESVESLASLSLAEGKR